MVSLVAHMAWSSLCWTLLVSSRPIAVKLSQKYFRLLCVVVMKTSNVYSPIYNAGDDNVYFSVKDVPPTARPGDEVHFQIRTGARGLVASQIKLIDASSKLSIGVKEGRRVCGDRMFYRQLPKYATAGLTFSRNGFQ